MGELLPCKHKALSSNPCSAKEEEAENLDFYMKSKHFKMLVTIF
jgi:hypothetical protein